jgi:hypothetical protein
MFAAFPRGFKSLTTRCKNRPDPDRTRSGHSRNTGDARASKGLNRRSFFIQIGASLLKSILGVFLLKQMPWGAI